MISERVFHSFAIFLEFRVAQTNISVDTSLLSVVSFPAEAQKSFPSYNFLGSILFDLFLSSGTLSLHETRA
jgi:hypothetical protein